jgi:hypothetical protein
LVEPALGHIPIPACRRTLALLTIALTAPQAADLLVKAPAQRPYDWGGCYFGVNAGAGAAGTNFTTAIAGGTHLSAADAAGYAAADGQARQVRSDRVHQHGGLRWQLRRGGADVGPGTG